MTVRTKQRIKDILAQLFYVALLLLALAAIFWLGSAPGLPGAPGRVGKATQYEHDYGTIKT